ncbi:TadE/TadG family type IV pilus assembly protein [Burkholderia sp. Ax-1724]|uniref:TadE/TadG family type IV pilus assembly protein n=1 Tax=Burkholderia sp. Ax-1724 TaxID=2608336 RepID=UPI00142270FB|nr:TadE/TadG family type IV pilus assembly protein [Burkholderia sp. Ax-1724]NIF53394.1 pilus assembly protein [Burkholderia sp. Ax-1724]
MISGTRPTHRLRGASALKKQQGVAAVEFALLAPVLLLIVLGVAQFGWLLGNYMMVANAASAGARYFASQRGTTSPYTATQTQVNASASLLKTSNLSIAASVNGTACTSDSACASGLTSAGGTSAVGTATVTVSYTFVPIFKGSLSGLYAMMPTTLNASAVERVQ